MGPVTNYFNISPDLLHYQALEVKCTIGALDPQQLRQTFVCKTQIVAFTNQSYKILGVPRFLFYEMGDWNQVFACVSKLKSVESELPELFIKTLQKTNQILPDHRTAR